MSTPSFGLEVIVVPVSDVDRALAFYRGLGWRQDADVTTEPGFRVVQLTPPGSACSIAMGVGIVDSAPGSLRGLQLVVSDIHAARAELAGRGVEASEVTNGPGGAFVYFADPDGNTWTVQDPSSA
jgi:catechol 2,3-dioxygenase-like lactoylglutathione lyase family enzyme